RGNDDGGSRHGVRTARMLAHPRVCPGCAHRGPIPPHRLRRRALGTTGIFRRRVVGDGERWTPEALAKHKVAGSTPVTRSQEVARLPRTRGRIFAASSRGVSVGVSVSDAPRPRRGLTPPAPAGPACRRSPRPPASSSEPDPRCCGYATYEELTWEV